MVVIMEGNDEEVKTIVYEHLPRIKHTNFLLFFVYNDVKGTQVINCNLVVVIMVTFV